MRRSLWLAAATLAGALVSAGPAWADSDVARQYFEAGKARRDENDCAKAIPEFEKSLAAERSIGAFYNLAYCHEHLNHRQDAYEAYRQAQQLARARQDDRFREISGALTSLLETPNIRIIFSRALPAGLQIHVDDQAIPAALYHAETVVFTDKPQRLHTVVISAPGYEDWRATIEAKGFKTVELTPTGHAEPPRPEPPWGWGQYVGTGAIVAGAGLAIVGTVFVYEYESELSRRHDVFEAACRGGLDARCQGPEGQAQDAAAKAYEDQKTKIVPHTIAYSAGGALLAGGILLFVLGPRPKGPADAEKSGKSLHIVPTLGGLGQGVAAFGTF